MHTHKNIHTSTDNVPSKILEFLHVKPGKGSAFVRTKVKNLINGSVQEKTFRAGESVIAAPYTLYKDSYGVIPFINTHIALYPV